MLDRQITPTVSLRDLDDRDAVSEMVLRFYRDVAMDDLLGPMFNDIAKVDWAEHLTKVTAFWCRALFAMPGYEGNPFRAHQVIHAQQAFTTAHFERWLELFYGTIESGWAGTNAEKAKALANKVARVHSHQLVVDPSNDPAEK